MLEFYLRFRYLRLHHYLHVTLHLPTKFHPNQTICDIVMTSYPLSKMAAKASQFYSRFRFSLTSLILEGCNLPADQILGEISQFTGEILLLSVPENKRPPCWNSTSDFDFHVCFSIGMSFSICPPNFVQIGKSATQC